MLEVRNIEKTYPGFSLKDISFQVEDGDYFVILGPSGAGKTQILEILAGLVLPDEGEVFMDGKEITWKKIQKRPFGMVFQDLAIFPHLSVRDNIRYPMRSAKIGRKEMDQVLNGLAESVEIAHLLNRMPGSLSGGELQRVALARTLVRQPRYLLLDEPLASLDVALRQGLRSLLKRLNTGGQTMIHVTHDYEEALVLANKVAVIDQGRIIQSGQADHVFHYPESEFIARFTGIKNYFPAKLYREQDRNYCQLENGQLIRVNTHEPDGRGFVLIKGEDIFITLEQLPTSATNQFKGMILEINPSPFGFEVIVDTGTRYYIKITRDSIQSLALRQGKEVWISFKASNARFVKV
jgi:molybdopterin-binding protein